MLGLLLSPGFQWSLRSHLMVAMATTQPVPVLVTMVSVEGVAVARVQQAAQGIQLQ